MLIRGLTTCLLLVGVVTGCAPASTSSNSSCAQTKSIMRPDVLNNPLTLEVPSGLLLTTHRRIDDSPRLPLSNETDLSKCNVFMELLNKETASIRLWTASHCIRRLTLTSLTLAVRDKHTATGGFFTWKIQHELLSKAAKMQSTYDRLGGYTDAKNRLARAWDRRRMTVYGESALLTPRVSCENLRWSEQADIRHSLCFSVFDLMHLDITLPESTSAQSTALLNALSLVQKTPSTETRLQQKRNTFLRRIDVTSQSEWIIHIGNLVRTWMSGFSISSLPMFSEEVIHLEDLNRNVFSLPHKEESSFMTLQNVSTQDAIPPAVNTTLQLIHTGTYSSTRKTINAVNVSCYRQLRRYNSSIGKVEVVPELELRPHEYCAGGEKQQADHFWNRDRPWSEMMADMTLGAAQDYAQEVKSVLLETAVAAEQLSRLTVVSHFEGEENLDIEAHENEDVSPFLRHLMIPVQSLTTQLKGLSSFEQTGALLFSLPRSEVKARFQKGDSGAILLLDGVPVATLYSVDGEETSGGATIRSLPEATSEELPSDDSTNTAASGRKGPVGPGVCSK